MGKIVPRSRAAAVPPAAASKRSRTMSRYSHSMMLFARSQGGSGLAGYAFAISADLVQIRLQRLLSIILGHSLKENAFPKTSAPSRAA
jgi:hypothetical protein